MKRIVSIILALMLCLTPFLSIAEEYTASSSFLSDLLDDLECLGSSGSPRMTVEFTDTEGQTTTAVIGQQADGSNAVSFQQADVQLILTELVSSLSSEAGVFSTSTQDVLNLLKGAAALPEITEDNLNALLPVLIDLLDHISTDAFSFAQSNSMINIHVNVDVLLQEIDAAMPGVLARHAEALDPLVQAVSSLVFAQSITCAELAALWPQLDLSGIKTGMEGDIVIMQLGNAVSMMANFMGHTLELRISDSDVNFSFLPAGAKKAYVYDSQDMLTLANVLVQIPVIEQEQNEETDITTTHITITRDQLLTTLTANTVTLDSLLVKYDPWLRLLTGTESTIVVEASQGPITAEVAPFSTEELSEWAEELPETILNLTVEVDNSNQTIAAYGFLGSVDFTFDLVETRNYNISWNATVSMYDRYYPISIVLAGNTDRYGNTSVTLSSNQAIFGAYTYTLRSSSAYTSMYWAESFAITTDTDVFHFIYEETYSLSRLDVKAGNVSFSFTADDDQASASLTSIDFFCNLFLSENRLSIDSTYFGLDYTLGDSFVSLEGYLASSYSFDTFDFLMDDSNELMTVFIQDDSGDGFHLTCQESETRLTMDGSTLVLRNVAAGQYEVLFDDELFATLLTESSIAPAGNSYRIRLLEGDGSSGVGYTLTISFTADTIVLPEGAETTSPEAFLQLVEEAFSPDDYAVVYVITEENVTETPVP